jgi:hypothetical protein
MSWQDDLRQLDQALAQGQVSADEYRKRRDQLLATAAGTAAAPPAEQPAASPAAPQPPSQPQQPPSQPQAQAGQPAAPGPFAPPFRWESNPESTQVVQGNADATQVVQSRGIDSTQVVQPVHSSDSDRTQAFRPVGQGQGPVAQAPWHSQPPESSPWGDANLDAPISAPNPTWLQGPEVFETDKGGSGGKIAKIVIAVVVVIGIGVGAFFFIRSQGENNQAQDPSATTSTSQPPTPTTRPKDDLEIAKLPGQSAERAEVTQIDDVAPLDVLKPEELAAYKKSDATKARLVISNMPRSVGALVLTVDTGSAANSKTAVTDLVQLQRDFTMKDYAGTCPAGVTCQQFAKSESFPAVIRSHYAHKGTVVRVQAAGDDMAQIAKVFDEVLAAQLAELPADG